MMTSFYLTVLALYLPFAGLWIFLRRRESPSQKGEEFIEIKPLVINFGLKNNLKAAFCATFNFMKTFSVKPGLYYTGEKDDNSPIFVTCNYFLTIFLLARRIGKRNVRLLVIDTDGINVWCSAGKGKFSAKAILEAAKRSQLLNKAEKVQIILPKFCLSGVKLDDLKKGGIKPVIGPLYAKDVPDYLDRGKLENRFEEIVSFGFQSRLFTAFTTAVQFFYYSLGLYVLGLGYIPFNVVSAVTALAFLYPILFPWLPGKLFTTKGLWQALFVVIGVFLLNLTVKTFLLWALFILATQLFIALSYTGNSAVSNYTGVRKETARFLPTIGLLYILIIPTFFLL